MQQNSCGVRFSDVRAHEILDSRGRTTLTIAVETEGRQARASVPSGWSASPIRSARRPVSTCGRSC